jgi:hypothetical protein
MEIMACASLPGDLGTKIFEKAGRPKRPKKGEKGGFAAFFGLFRAHF